jgi:isochorismate synthase EntC
VAIRCGYVKGCQLRLIAGAGIVPGSDPEEEWEELDDKIRNYIDLWS